MLTLRRATDRGVTNWGWLESHHTFSFGDYHDPSHMGFRSLRVLNDDRVEPGAGFGTHGHRDMEILTYVLDGALEHRDSMGTGSVIRPGEIQFMRAGTGVTHSEMNASKADPVHFLQIWIVPNATGLHPAYGQQAVDLAKAGSEPVLMASRDGRRGSIEIRQDADLYVARPAKNATLTLPLAARHHAYVHVARGRAHLLGLDLDEGDGASVSGEIDLSLEGRGNAEVLVFDLA
jgi:redox-sensitive bicupin YhaK (pirin superfamily)